MTRRDRREAPKTFVYEAAKKLDKEKGDAMVARLALTAQHVEAALKRARQSLEGLREALGRS